MINLTPILIIVGVGLIWGLQAAGIATLIIVVYNVAYTIADTISKYRR